jgi:Putative adhesin
VPDDTPGQRLCWPKVITVGTPEIRLCGRSSKITITALPSITTVRVDGVDVAMSAPDVYEVTRSSSKIDIECPEGSAVSISTASGSITARGRLGPVRILTVSGKIRLEHVAELEARSASARMDIGTCDGCCRLVTGSGRVELERSDRVEIATVSGAVRVDSLASGGKVRTVTGTVHVDAAATAQLVVHTVSGKVDVQLPAAATGSLALRSISGRVTGHLPHGDDAHIEVSTISGTIEVRAG